MAPVRLEHQEAEGGYLPPVCICCGALATCQRRKRFQQNAPSGMLMKTWLVAPFCDAHRGHWLRRAVAIPLSFLVFAVAVCGGIGFAHSQRATDPDAPKWQMGIMLVGVLGWLGFIIYLHYTSVRVSAVKTDSLLVQGVGEGFPAALEQHRQSAQRHQPLTLEGVDRTRRQVRLFRDELAVMPALCVCCGEPAVHRITKKIPSRIQKKATAGQVAAVLVFGWWAIIMAGDKTGEPWQVPFPVCETHRTYWRNRTLLILAGFVLPVVGFALAMGQALPQSWMVPVTLTSMLGFVGWAIVSIFLHESSNKAGTATQNSLVLRNVPRGFVDAVEEQRRREGHSPMAPPLIENPNSTDIQPDRSELPRDAYGPGSP